MVILIDYLNSGGKMVRIIHMKEIFEISVRSRAKTLIILALLRILTKDPSSTSFLTMPV